MLQQRKIPVCAPLVGEREVEVVTRAIRSSWISSMGPQVQEFESKFAAFCETKFGVATNSGTSLGFLGSMALIGFILEPPLLVAVTDGV